MSLSASGVAINSIMDEKKKVTKAAGKVSLGTLISRVAGFARDIVLAAVYGTTWVTDAYFVAFRIPNLLRELFAEGSVSAGFVPVFIEQLTKEGKDEAKKLAGVVFAFLLCVLIVICLLGILLAPYIASVVARGFMSDPAKFELTIKLIRIMFPFLLFISLAALAMGTLNSLKSFFVPALAPAFFNLALIASVLFMAQRFAVPILAAGIGVTIGGAIQYGVQAAALAKQGFSPRPVFSFSHPGLKKIIKLVLPVVAAMGVTQLNVLISNLFATYLAEGSATYLYYGWRLTHLPIGLFAIAMATALLPSLSEQAARNDLSSFRDTFSFSLRIVFFITIPAMAGLMVMAEPIMNTLFQRGEFTYEGTIGAANALLFYATGIWAFAGLRPVRMAFYSLQDTRTPLKIAVLSVVVNVIFSLMLMGPLKHGGLALANAIAAAVNFSALFFLLRSKLGRIDGVKIIKSFIKTFAASLIMGTVGMIIVGQFTWTRSGKLGEKAGILAASIALCVAVYILVSYLIKSEELSYLIKLRKKKS
ncbi:MAG TPA: murein biosynthesis integral membrane protein MurJ [Nitrospirae bacterium]|nr:putative peptidoglycan biosynthesis protein MurJ [bacterium BMS3Abin10]GBE39683.1 putative peptidoglycan biosynthesis protein MurJ [bacterium BMS3Bbin08]HDH50702.1 murein biosynthesis integral membrane protein MurJ [Nitrospirota bacterium]HDK16648.1 murein biosynthesis integral membrane protein MurJ [Nitrospirota bacterium]HDK41604.1 murein biosynthesis integral membrane protein MurJ [Nitrospirota bacterium]